MQAMDAICQKFGREAIRFLGSGMARSWASKQDNRSNRALTQWKEIPIVVRFVVNGGVESLSLLSLSGVGWV